ncbi:MAG: M23 family metallopeptidase [Spirochaetia bacterium]|nr:M23 family metallopeptidase [Spirochaetia bacterium]
MIHQYLKAFSILAFILTVNSSTLHAETISVPVDNEYVQTFRGIIGRWLVPGKDSIQYLANISGVTPADILKANGGKYSSNSHVFIPYSEAVHKKLLAEGKGRRIQSVEHNRLLWPVETPAYTSRYGVRGGENHPGLDFGCARNTVVVAADDGVIVKAGWYGGLGLAVAVQHASGYVTWYAHNTSVMLPEGERIVRGQILAYSGSTGRSTGPHVHFEVRFMDVHMDPEDFLQFGYVRPGLVVREGPEEAVSQNVGLDSVVMTGQRPAQN